MDFPDRREPALRPGRLPHLPAPERPVVVPVPVGATDLPGVLVVPPHAVGAVVLAQCSGNSGSSIRNRAVAHSLNQAGLATLLLELLTPAEAGNQYDSSDTPLVAGRLVQAVRWLATTGDVARLPIGLFGACAGAAVLWAAAELGGDVSSAVCWSGRPELARPRLGHVTAPTLLIVGGRDNEGLESNLWAQGLLRCPTYLRVVPEATRLFTEPGTLEEVQATAAGWFRRHIDVDVTRRTGELVRG